jgi:hypothetical protein
VPKERRIVSDKSCLWRDELHDVPAKPRLGGQILPGAFGPPFRGVGLHFNVFGEVPARLVLTSSNGEVRSLDRYEWQDQVG